MMNKYISTTYKELTDISKFLKAKAWLLVTQIMTRIFHDMNAAIKGIVLVHSRTSGLTNMAKNIFYVEDPRGDARV